MRKDQDTRPDWLIVSMSVVISIVIMRIISFLVKIMGIYFEFLPPIFLWFIKTNIFLLIISICCAIYVTNILRDKSYKTNRNILIILMLVAIIPMHIKINVAPVVINKNNQSKTESKHTIEPTINIVCKLMDNGKVIRDNIITDKDIQGAILHSIDGRRYGIRLILTEEGTNKIKEITSEEIGKEIAFFVDGKQVCSSEIITEIVGGTIVMDGNFTKQDAVKIMNRINSNNRIKELRVSY